MMACVTDNEVLAMLWHRTYGAPEPHASPVYDYESARVQLRFIHQMAAANPSWMQIVTTPAEARQAIQANKLTLVLSVEMDALTIEQIIALKDEFQIRHVIPIHLANNSIGGVAVYHDVFNTSNHYLTGKFLDVTGDPAILFQLSRPQRLVYLTNDPFRAADPNDYIAYDAIKFGVVEPVFIRDGDYAALHYPTHEGHKNSTGLDVARLEMLMRHGLMIDLSHMSENSQASALTAAQHHIFPLMNSHTGMRPDPEDGLPASGSERDMRRSFARTMVEHGGVIGLGTSRSDRAFAPDEDPMRTWVGIYRDALALTGGHGIGIGTDINGFTPQIPLSRSAPRTSYPITAANRLAPPALRDSVPTLGKSVIGDKTFNFRVEGLAHYGMLPDFIQAIHDTLVREGRGDADRLVGQLFKGAEEVVSLWEKVEQAARRMRASHGPHNAVPMDLFWSPARGDNFSTATNAGRQSALDAGYEFVRTEGYILADTAPGTVPLTLFWHSGRGDNFVAASDAGRRDANIAHYSTVRIEGHVFSTQTLGSVALNLFWSEARGDNFVTCTRTGRQDAEASGYRFVRTEGFIYPRAVGLQVRGGQFMGAQGGGGIWRRCQPPMVARTRNLRGCLPR